MTNILDRLKLSNGEELGIDLPDNVGLGTLFYNWESIKSEVKRLQNELKGIKEELQLKTYILKN